MKTLREALPDTFINIRLDTVSINNKSNADIKETIRKLVANSNNPFLTRICRVNMDNQVQDSKVKTILKTVQEIKKEIPAENE